jgi:3-deoxy-D-manno-octulosonic-acid transferase
VAWLGAASAGDASRWARLGVPEQSIVVTGDTRHDQVLERITRLRLVRPLLEWARGQTALVAGSTDRCDARLLLDAFSQVRAYHADARLILVPHDCSEGRIAQVIAIADQACVRTEVWDGGIPKPETHCLVVNAMGMLADIYAVGHMAYVGGGFVRGGLHAVVEPAALGLPVIVGPLYESGVDASLLVELGGAVALPRRAADNTMLLTWRNWIDEPNARNAAGLNARRALRQGAATTTVTALLELLGRDPRLLWNARIVKEAPL